MEQASKNPDYKVIIVGNASVGKTALMLRFVKDQYSDKTEATIGASMLVKEWKGIFLACWDTAGAEKFAPISSFYCRNAHAAIIAYDITERSSFANIEKHWKVLEHAHKDCLVFLVGCKQDLADEAPDNRKVTTQEAREFAENMRVAGFFETSAKSGKGVEELFDALGSKLSPSSFHAGAAQPPSSSSSAPRKDGIVKLDTQASPQQQQQQGCC